MRFLLSFTTALAALSNVALTAPVTSTEVSNDIQQLTTDEAGPSTVDLSSLVRRAPIAESAMSEK